MKTQSKSRRRAAYARRRKAGKCSDCSDPAAVGRSRCAECMEKRRVVNAKSYCKRRDERVAAGLCVNCDNPSPDYALCDACREKARVRERDKAMAFQWERSDGEHNKQSKLSESEVVHIHRCAWAGVPQTSLAAMFGINPSAVSMIKHGRTWGYLKLNKVKARV